MSFAPMLRRPRIATLFGTPALLGLLIASISSAAPAAPAQQAPRRLAAPIEKSVMDLPIAAARADRTATAAPAASGGPRTDGNETIPQADDHLIFSNRFQELDGTCNDRGWLQEDRTTRVYGHVDSRFVTNSAFWSAVTAPIAQIQHPAPLDTNPIHISGVIAVESPTRVVWLDNIYTDSGIDAFTFDRGANQATLRAAGTGLTLAQAAVVKPNGDLIVADETRLYRYTSPGTPPVILTGATGASSSDTLASAATLALLNTQLQADAAGNVWFSEPLTGRIRMLRANDDRIVTMVGAGGTINSQVLFGPRGFAFDPAGNRLYVLDSSGFAVYSYDLTTQVRTLFAGGDGDNIPLFSKAAVVNGDLYAAAYGNGNLYRVPEGAISTSALEVVVGQGQRFGSAATRTNADRFANTAIHDLAADGAGGILFTSQQLPLVLRYDTATGQLALAGGAPNPIDMGSRAFWFGADMNSAPDEVRHWVVDHGYGNNWGQWLESPSIPLGGTSDVRLSFDLALELSAFFENEYFDVLVQDATGAWQGARFQMEVGGPRGPDIANFFGSYRYAMTQGLAKLTVHLNAPENSGIVFGASTRFRLYMRTNAITSTEDGFDFYPQAGGAIFDNLRVTDAGSDLIPPVDFEDGGTGGWTPGARNFAFDGNNNTAFSELAPAGTGVSLQQNFDAANTSCVWTFLSPGDSVGPGIVARLTSPWIRRFAPSADLLINFSGKLPTVSQKRFMSIAVRGKNVGETRPSVYSPGLFLFNSGAGGGDAASPYVNRRQLISQLDLQSQPTADSVQLVIEIQERERTVPSPTSYSRLPFLDEIEVMELAADSDWDGIADAIDACPSVCAAGQDADGDGCPDPTATMRHVESWPASRPNIPFVISGAGMPGINDGSAVAAVRAAAAAWSGVAGAVDRLAEQFSTPQVAASALDGVNLVTFQDPNLEFPPSVLAVTPTLSFNHTMNYGDRVVPQGEIVDADVIVNGEASLSTSTHPGDFDLQGVMTHEFGHLLGLTHSGVKDATMYFVQLPAEDARSLEPDDHAALAAAYPSPQLGPDFSSIQGVVLRDTSASGLPGALVTAVRLDGGGAPMDTVASDYTDENGSYKLFRLPPGDYGIHIQALDGSVLDGLSPGFISERLALIADTSFEPEWFSTGDSFSDDPALKTVITLANGDDYLGADLVSNLDTSAPSVTSINPADATLDVGVDATLLVNFSEPVSPASLQAAFGLRVQGDGTRLAGNGILSGFGRTFVFTPAAALKFDTQYELTITTALADGNGVHPAADFVSTFRTQSQPAVSISDIQPRNVLPGGTITVTGAGFDAINPANLIVSFSNGDTSSAGFVTPTSFVTTVPLASPSSAMTATVFRFPGPVASNIFNFNLVTPAPQGAPVPFGSAIGVPFIPRDVVMSSDGGMVYVAGDGGFATINLDPALAAAQPVQHPLRVAVSRLAGDHRRIVLSTDGQRAYISVPGAQSLLEVDAVPSSVTFGSVRDSIPVQGDPAGLVVAPTGKRLWYTDQSSLRIGEVNVDQASAAKNEVVRTLDTYFQPTGGLAVDDGGQDLHYTATTAAGRFVLSSGAQAQQASGFLRPGVVIDQYGRNAYYAAGSSGLFRVGLLNSVPTLIATGGSISDVTRSPIGPTVFAVNDGTNRLLVVNADSTSGSFGGLAAEIATGSGPTAVTVNANGGTIAVANAGDQTISLYSYGAASAPTALRVVPTAAIPGEAVAVHGTPAGSGFTPGTMVDLLAGAPFLAQNAQTEAAGFTVPDITARSTSVTLARPDGQRTLGLPFQVVEPLPTFAPRTAGLSIDPQTFACFLPVNGRLMHPRLSPDGRRLVVLSETSCNTYAQVFSLTDDDVAPLGSVLLWGIPIGGFELTDHAAITPDGRFLWIASGQLGARIFDIDPASPTAGTIAGTVGVGPLGNPRAILADPLGRFMICATHTGTGPGSDGISLWPTNGVDSPITSIPGTTGVSMAASGDGRYLVAGDVNRAHIIDLNSRTLITTTAARGNSGATYLSVAISRDGKRAVGLLAEPITILPSGFTMWNLDPAAGPVGAEIYHGQVPGTVGQVFTDVHPAPDGNGFFMMHAMDPQMIHLMVDEGGFSSGVTVLPFVPSSLTLSHDGRRLWAVRNGASGLSASDAEIVMFDVSRATALSVVSGAAQSGLASSVLPVPIRVRVTHGAGLAESGVMVRFATGGLGAGTIAGTGGRTEVVRITDTNGEAEVHWQLPAGSPASFNMLVTALGVPGGTALVPATLVADDVAILPELVELGPADGATNVNAGTQLFARFNQRMQPSVAGSITVRVGGNPVTTTQMLSDGGRFVLVTPAAPLPFGSTCQIEVAAGALDTDGQVLAAGGQATFTVQAQPALALRNLSPPSGPVGASVAINGEGFSPTPALNTVRINGAVAQVTSATLTSLVCEVPNNATSGPLTVEVSGTVSDPLGFLVLTGTGVGGALGDLPAGSGIRDIAVTPDGSRVYVTNPSLNTVSALQIADALNLGNITVGLQPQGVALTPDGLRAYTANTGSNDVSVIVTDPAAGADYNTEIKKIPVGPAPVDVAISGTSKVVVVNEGDGTLSVIDGNPANVATYDRVTTTVNCGAGGKSVAISADGTRAYVAVDAGLAIIDLLAAAVTTTVNCGAAGQAVAISADNTLAFVLTATGELKVIQLAEGREQYQVVTSVNCGAGGKSVAISADGTRAFVTLADGATVLVFEIRFANGAQNSSIIPGPSIVLVPAPSVPVGEGAAGMAVDVSGVPRIYVANSVAGTVTIIGFPEGLPTLPVEFQFNPQSLNLHSMGRWVKGTIEPEAPARAEDIVLESIRLNGSVAVDLSAPHGLGDADGDGQSELTVRFLRSELDLVLPTGDEVPVTVTGLIGPRLFSGTDLIRVKRGSITAPAPHAILQPGAPFTIQWTTPNGVNAEWVQVAHSFDGGASWTVAATQLPNTGSYTWNVPLAAADSALVAVAIVEEELTSMPGGTGGESAPGSGADPEAEIQDNVIGVLAMSGYFRVFGVTSVESAPVALQFLPVQPNPARSAAHLRFGLPQRTNVALEVFDLQGRRIKTLARGVRAPGWHDFDWNGRDDAGGAVDAGLYFVRLKAAGREMNQRLVWLR